MPTTPASRTTKAVEGDITIDVAEGTVTIDHNDRFVELCNTTTEV